MAKYVLGVGENRVVKTSSRFLSIVELSGQMTVESPAFSLKPITVKAGYQLDLDGITEVTIKNIDTVQIESEIEDAGIKITSGGGGAVSVTNKVVVDRIEQPQAFEANVTFNGGDVGLLAGSALNTLANVSCPINASTMLANINTARKSLLIQNLSAEPVRIGGNQVAAGKGFVLEAGAASSWPTTAAIFAYNEGAAPVICALTEM